MNYEKLYEINDVCYTFPELTQIQKDIIVPKARYNQFGKYEYRSLEDILKAIKPALEKHNCRMFMNDSIEVIGDRFYVKVTVSLENSEGNRIRVSSYAREEAEKKGMDASQITGAAGSYAAKTALGRLFLIDSTSDADAMQREEKEAQEKASLDVLKVAIEEIKKAESMDDLTLIFKKYPKYAKSPDFLREGSLRKAYIIEHEEKKAKFKKGGEVKDGK